MQAKQRRRATGDMQVAGALLFEHFEQMINFGHTQPS
jgi:hypothetical protein